ncbi:hypothetical protein MBLNU459_g4894t1 [Dothideomycetes sp. NU459]
MGRSKELLKKPVKASKNKAKALLSADDFQEAADLEEETGGKWRAGDQAKSSRAFLRAIQIYNDGLQKHPKNFDLAYNKARLEFDLSQQSTLVPKLPMTLLEMLQQALSSHRFALRLNEENADILFNTAQVMISIAENVTENGISTSQTEIVPLLREALELLSACYSRQEMLMEEQSQQFVDDSDGGVSLGAEDFVGADGSDEQVSARGSPDAEQSASIQIPITSTDLLDTARASLSALTLLVLLDEPANIPTLAQLAQNLSEEKIPQRLSQIDAEEAKEIQSDVALERAEFIAALANADYRKGSISIDDILSRLKIFETLNLTSDVAVMCTYADALVEFVTTAQSYGVSSTDVAATCWTQLTKSQDLYNRAVKVDDEEARQRKAQIYESRGDVELLRLGLASSEAAGLSASIRSSAPTLVKNAQTYYRGASNLFKAQGAVQGARNVEIRGAIAAVLEARLAGQVSDKVAFLQKMGDEAVAVAIEMTREGLLPDGWDQDLA